MKRTIVVAAAALLVGAGWTLVRAQVPATPATASPDIMPALLEEVRGLRQAMEQMSSAGPRVQLALGRLQLQELRMSGAIKRADDARTRLAQLLREQTEMQQQQRGFETTLTEIRERGRVSGEGPSAEEMAGMVEHHKRLAATHNTEVQRVAAEEAVFAAEVTTEQARWTEINQRLEELERALRPLK